MTFLFVSLPLVAQENQGKSEESKDGQQNFQMPKTMFLPMVTILGVYQPESEIIDAKIPFFMPMAQARFSHRFTEWGKLPELSFNANGELAPVWLNAQASFDIKPFKFLTFSAGGKIGTSWGMDMGFIAFDLIGEYDAEKARYDAFTPFSHWVCEGFLQAAFAYDIGSLLAKEKQHITFKTNFRASYIGMTGVANGEIWMSQGQKGMVNGFCYSVTTSLDYKLPFSFPITTGASANVAGYFSDCFFDEKYKGFDGDFTTITLAATATASITRKDMFMLMIPFSGVRKFDTTDAEKQPLMQIEDGRRWKWGGIVLTYTHIF